MASTSSSQQHGGLVRSSTIANNNEPRRLPPVPGPSLQRIQSSGDLRSARKSVDGNRPLPPPPPSTEPPPYSEHIPPNRLPSVRRRPLPSPSVPPLPTLPAISVALPSTSSLKPEVHASPSIVAVEPRHLSLPTPKPNSGLLPSTTNPTRKHTSPSNSSESIRTRLPSVAPIRQATSPSVLAEPTHHTSLAVPSVRQRASSNLSAPPYELLSTVAGVVEEVTPLANQVATPRVPRPIIIPDEASSRLSIATALPSPISIMDDESVLSPVLVSMSTVRYVGLVEERASSFVLPPTPHFSRRSRRIRDSPPSLPSLLPSTERALTRSPDHFDEDDSVEATSETPQTQSSVATPPVSEVIAPKQERIPSSSKTTDGPRQSSLATTSAETSLPQRERALSSSKPTERPPSPILPPRSILEERPQPPSPKPISPLVPSRSATAMTKIHSPSPLHIVKTTAQLEVPKPESSSASESTTPQPKPRTSLSESPTTKAAASTLTESPPELTSKASGPPEAPTATASTTPSWLLPKPETVAKSASRPHPTLPLLYFQTDSLVAPSLLSLTSSFNLSMPALSAANASTPNVNTTASSTTTHTSTTATSSTLNLTSPSYVTLPSQENDDSNYFAATKLDIRSDSPLPPLPLQKSMSNVERNDVFEEALRKTKEKQSNNKGASAVKKFGKKWFTKDKGGARLVEGDKISVMKTFRKL